MLKFSSGLRTLMATTDGIQHAMANGILELRTGAPPADADQAATGTLLMIISISSGAFTPGSPTNGINFDNPTTDGSGNVIIAKDVDEVWSGLGIADGVIGWFRHKANGTDAGGVSTSLPRIDGTVGVGGADLNVVSTTVQDASPGPATPLTIDEYDITLPPGIGS